MDAPEEYYYFSDQTDSIGGVIKVLSQNMCANIYAVQS